MSVQEHSTGVSTKFPNDPSEYCASMHFRQMKRDRNIHGHIIREVFESGELQKAQGNSMKFVKEVDGFEWWFIVSESPGANTLETAYVPEFNDKDHLYKRNI